MKTYRAAIDNGHGGEQDFEAETLDDAVARNGSAPKQTPPAKETTVPSQLSRQCSCGHPCHAGKPCPEVVCQIDDEELADHHDFKPCGCRRCDCQVCRGPTAVAISTARLYAGTRSVDDLAAEAGIDRATWYRVEAGDETTVSTLRAIARVLGISITIP